MTKLKTPIIKSFREKGGTFCTFNSAIEDIGLNVNEKQNKVRLSHYAILDIPNCDYNDTTEINKFNLLSSPNAFYLTHCDEEINNKNVTPATNMAQSFMSYALNMEAVIRNQNNTNTTYDYTTHLSVSERVFWKWLKETGAIRWERAHTFIDGQKNENEYSDTYFTEPNDEVNKYNSVVKAFGKIDAVSQRSSDYGIYNEVYVNIPSSFGKNSNILFKQLSDDNYKFGTVYAGRTSQNNNLEGHINDSNILNTGLYNKGYYDYSSATSVVSPCYTLNGQSNKFWYNNYTISESNDFNAFYITDSSIENITNNSSLNDVITIKDASIDYKILRSKLDCMMLELDCINLSKALDVDNITYDKLNTTMSSDVDYKFNTILVYYSIYDDTDNIIATNLYGVYFIDSPIKVNNAYYKNEHFYDFELPRLTKKKSSIEGFGTSYSFKLNIRTSSIYDDKETEIYDNSSSENSLISDFSSVVNELNNSILLLNKHTKNTEVLINKYNELYQMYTNLFNDIERLKTELNNIKK